MEITKNRDPWLVKVMMMIKSGTCDGRKWNCMSGCSTPALLRMNPPAFEKDKKKFLIGGKKTSRCAVAAAPVLRRNHSTPT